MVFVAERCHFGPISGVKSRSQTGRLGYPKKWKNPSSYCTERLSTDYADDTDFQLKMGWTNAWVLRDGTKS
jgi:hypothetical protein